MAIKCLADVVKDNREEMIKIFKDLVKSKSKLLGKNGKFSLGRRYFDSPYILINSDGDEGGTCDYAVMSVELDSEKNVFHFYLDKNLYYDNTECLALTENNVYETLWDIICDEEKDIARKYMP